MASSEKPIRPSAELQPNSAEVHIQNTQSLLANAESFVSGAENQAELVLSAEKFVNSAENHIQGVENFVTSAERHVQNVNNLVSTAELHAESLTGLVGAETAAEANVKKAGVTAEDKIRRPSAEEM